LPLHTTFNTRANQFVQIKEKTIKLTTWTCIVPPAMSDLKLEWHDAGLLIAMAAPHGSLTIHPIRLQIQWNDERRVFQRCRPMNLMLGSQAKLFPRLSPVLHAVHLPVQETIVSTQLVWPHVQIVGRSVRLTSFDDIQ
jgi:hypothetical protein